MKKNRIALTVLALIALAGCQTNELSSGYLPQEGEIVLKIANSTKKTKSADIIAQDKGVSIPVKTELGMSFTLDEAVTSLDEVAFAPVTKGTPGFTEDFHDLYNGFDATVYRKGESDAYEEDGRFEIVNEQSLIYKRKYGNDLWDKGGLYFFLKATPKDKTVDGIENLTYYPEAVASDGETPARKAGDISFHYVQSSTKTAEAQQDILFTSRPVTSEEEYKKLISKEEGVNILFHHALTGVKFRVGNDNSGTTKTIITKVEISGLYDIADCVISPDPETNYTDVTDNYSSGRAVTWSNRKSTLVNFSQEYSNPDYTVNYKTVTDTESGETVKVFDQDKNKANSDGTVSTADYQNGKYTFGSSWYSAAADNNLNDANGTQTFWFIPQAFKDEKDNAREVTLKVTFRVKTPDTPDGTEIVHTISDFGSRLAAANVEWKAGELRTYTLNPLDVDVEIFDSISGLEKSGLHVTNTGNVDEYVRMLLIGNWYGWTDETTYNNYQNAKTKADSIKYQPYILVGYENESPVTVTDPDTGAKTVSDPMVVPWYRKTSPYNSGFDSTFSGGSPASGNGWIKGTGSYFYYPDPIGVGDYLSSSDALFQSYTVDPSWIPTIWVPSTSGGRIQAFGVHLVMECVVQAIGVPAKKDSSGNPIVDGEGNPVYMDCWEAWSAATGEKIEIDE